MQKEPFYSELDAHIHLQTFPNGFQNGDSSGRKLISNFFTEGRRVICNGTSALDWSAVAELKDLFPENIISYFGVHPWYADTLPQGWIKLLRKYLLHNGSGIGEIGLDKKNGSRSNYFDQKNIFITQLSLAEELGLPVSIHCVRAWGDLMTILDKPWNIPVMIHSFSGSMEIMEKITDIGIYLSFSPFINSRNGIKIQEVFRNTPSGNILIESDFSFKKNISPYDQFLAYEQSMQSIYLLAGALKNMDPEQIRKEVNDNGKIFTDKTPPGQ